MSKQQKGNREAKKPKKQSDGTKKQKKDPNRHDGLVTRIVKSSNEQRNIEP
ncbi:hypothetical protein [Fischerella sp. PCC 9605]|uniref:hypothetical protein n=1 Tax=Fischerella sp. PCC 9605 TaxID=1173024 RepID=UPI0018CC45BE|nr:hypothetical protein [Fischerella sp. PCC 9605]